MNENDFKSRFRNNKISFSNELLVEQEAFSTCLETQKRKQLARNKMECSKTRECI